MAYYNPYIIGSAQMAQAYDAAEDKIVFLHDTTGDQLNKAQATTIHHDLGGMDANTDTISSQSLSQAYLSQRWYDVGFLFSQLRGHPPQPTCFAKGNPMGPEENLQALRDRNTQAGRELYCLATFPKLEPLSLDMDMGVSKNRCTPNWMVYNGKPY